jgi:hypothetical protein
MRGYLVVAIDLEFLGNSLFDDEHLAAQGIRLALPRMATISTMARP